MSGSSSTGLKILTRFIILCFRMFVSKLLILFGIIPRKFVKLFICDCQYKPNCTKTNCRTLVLNLEFLLGMRDVSNGISRLHHSDGAYKHLWSKVAMIPHYNHISPRVSVDGVRMINSGYDSTYVHCFNTMLKTKRRWINLKLKEWHKNCSKRCFVKEFLKG